MTNHENYVTNSFDLSYSLQVFFCSPSLTYDNDKKPKKSFGYYIQTVPTKNHLAARKAHLGLGLSCVLCWALWQPEGHIKMQDVMRN